jgi:hypothetical protein
MCCLGFAAAQCCCCITSAACRTSKCSRLASTAGYVALTVLTALFAGTLKAYVAPEIVAAAKTAAGEEAWGTVDGVEANLFYSFSDCAGRADTIFKDSLKTNDRVLLQRNGVNVTRDDVLTECIGNFFVYRSSFALCGFYVFMLFATAASTMAHRGCWGPKLLLYLPALGVMFFLPNALFFAYSGVARVLSIVFILLQVFILVDFAFDWWEDFGAKLEEAGKEEGRQVKLLCCHGTLAGVQCLFLACAAGMFLVGFVGTVLLYVWYTGASNGADCGLNVLFITLTLLLGIAAYVVAVVECGGDSIGLLVPSVVFCYCVYVTWTAVFNNPDAACAPMDGSFGNDAGMTFIGLCVGAFSIGWASVRTAGATRSFVEEEAGGTGGDDEEKPGRKRRQRTTKKKDDNLLTQEMTNKKEKKKKKKKGKKEEKDDGDVENALEFREGGEGKDKKKKEEGGAALEDVAIDQVEDGDDNAMDEEEKADQGRWHWLFHLIMSFGAVYLSMILSNWGSATSSNYEDNKASAFTAMWVNAVGCWFCYLLFFWIRFAPAICTNRDFSAGRNQF